LLRAELIVGLVVIARRILLGRALRIVSSASGGCARDNKSCGASGEPAPALVTGSTRIGAQEQPSPAPPDLRMLLNLDLFRPHSSDAGNDAAGQGSNNSMLDQIRALKAMGYLRGNQDFEGMSRVLQNYRT